MQYFILCLSALNNSFSFLESGNQIRFRYHHVFKSIGNIDNISSEDFILGYKRGDNIVKYVFKVIDVDLKSNELIIEKILESGNGVIIEDGECIDKLEREEIIKIEERNFIEIYNKLLNNLNTFDEENAPIAGIHSESDEHNDDLESDRICCGRNTLIYGVPGVGKSWIIKNEKCKDIDEHYIERVVFHPDYTYSDFVGQILPKVSEGDVKYEFVPGPFTNILKKAYENNTQKVFLIIEEINRGNAPAIFGDVFQLLDRMKYNENGFKKGTSEFGITNADMANEIYGDEKRKVRIPSNLNIISTMNTSDQNVFTLDTAFKRRWHMEMVENDFTKPQFKDTPIPNSSISWEIFGTAINEIILEESNSTLSSEDKRLGAFFVDEEDLKSSRQFSEKVLMYLWDDVFKFSREDYFNKKCVEQFCLESISKKFETNDNKNKFEIFTDKINNKITEVKEKLSDGTEENDSE